MLWKDYAEQVLEKLSVGCHTAVKEIVDKVFVQAIDACDNGQTNKKLLPEISFSDIIFSMNCQWDENSPSDAAFEAAVSLAKTVLIHQIKQAEAKAKAFEIVLEKAQKCVGPILVLNQFIPWQSAVQKSENNILFVVFPASRGGYNVKCVSGRILFPVNWRGKKGNELKAVTDVDDASFCHTGGFLANAATCRGAVDLANKAIPASMLKAV